MRRRNSGTLHLRLNRYQRVTRTWQQLEPPQLRVLATLLQMAGQPIGLPLQRYHYLVRKEYTLVRMKSLRKDVCGAG